MAAEKRKREANREEKRGRGKGGKFEGTWPRGCAGLMLDENAPRDLFAAMMQDASPASKELSFATSVTDIVSDMFFFFEARNKLKFDPFFVFKSCNFWSCILKYVYIYRVTF